MTTIDDYFKDRLEVAGNDNTLSHCPPFGDVMENLTKLSEKGIELTITFKPELTYRWNSSTLTRLVRDILLRVDCKCILIGEYSKTGMYHMHGSILAKPRVIGGLRRKLTREIGRCEFKVIRWVESWVTYCFKEEESIEPKQLLKEELIYII